MGFYKNISKKLLLFINIGVTILFLLACLAAFVNPSRFSLLYILNLGLPYLFIMLIFFAVFWLAVYKKWALISVITIVLGGGAITNLFALHFGNGFAYKKTDAHIRIVTWNVARFVEMIKNNNRGSQTRYKMLQQIKKANADILCFQEFSSSIDPDWYNNILAISKGLGYPYMHYVHDWDGSRHFNGSIIFSRLPIEDKGSLRYPRPTLPEDLVFVDIKKDNKIFRLYTTHLQSNQFRKQDISKIEELKNVKGNIVSNAISIFKKLQTAISYRSIQADMIGEVLPNSPYPVIFCGDMNDVPNSYTYHTVKGDMQDAFLKKGFGIGRSYNSLAPTLRIDYVFTDDNFTVQQFKRVVNNYSDHYMIICDLSLNATTTKNN